MCSPKRRFVSGTIPFKAQIIILFEISMSIFFISALTYSEGTATIITSDFLATSEIFAEIFNLFSLSSTALKYFIQQYY